MSVITWGQLPKSQDDPEKIEEAIRRIVEEHNQDETAHQGEGQALNLHKTSEVIDHLIKSIVRDKIADFAISPEKFAGDRVFLIGADINLYAWEHDCEGDASFTRHLLSNIMRTGNTVGSWIYFDISPYYPSGLISLNKDIVFQVSFRVSDATNQEVRITFGAYMAGDDIFGFRIINNKLYSWSRKLRYPEEYEEQRELLNIEPWTVYIVRAIYKPQESKIYFYVDQLLKAIHEEVLPEKIPESFLNLYIETKENDYKRLIIHDYFLSFGR